MDKEQPNTTAPQVELSTLTRPRTGFSPRGKLYIRSLPTLPYRLSHPHSPALSRTNSERPWTNSILKKSNWFLSLIHPFLPPSVTFRSLFPKRKAQLSSLGPKWVSKSPRDLPVTAYRFSALPRQSCVLSNNQNQNNFDHLGKRRGQGSEARSLDAAKQRSF